MCRRHLLHTTGLPRLNSTAAAAPIRMSKLAATHAQNCPMASLRIGQPPPCCSGQEGAVSRQRQRVSLSCHSCAGPLSTGAPGVSGARRGRTLVVHRQHVAQASRLQVNLQIALHAMPTAQGGEEFHLRGVADEILDVNVRTRLVAATGGRQGIHPFEALFRCRIDSALHTVWENWGTAQTWPSYHQWRG